jgi:signal transduction histidine kinase
VRFSRLARSLGSSEVLAGLAAAAIAIVVALAAVMANSESLDRTASNAAVAVEAEDVLSAAAAARNNLSQAQVLTAAAAAAGAADATLVEAQIEDALRSLQLLRGRIANFRPVLAHAEGLSLGWAGTELDRSADEVLAALERGDAATGRTIIEGPFETAYDDVVDVVADERATRLNEMGLTQAGAGRIANAVRFVVGFFVPLGAVVSYALLARRRLAGRDLEHRLERQKAVMATKDELVSGISHQLRTPLTGIYGYSQVLMEDPSSSVEQREMAGAILGEAETLRRMVDDLIVAAAGTQVRVEICETDPSAVVAEALAPFRSLGLHIPASLDPGTVSADPLRLRHLLGNLLANAVHHGGARRCVVGKAHRDRYVIHVIDDGPGVPEDRRTRLFDRFIHVGSTALEEGSVGLGLGNARLLAEKMGGTLAYQRESGLTSFDVALPLHHAPAERRIVRPADAKEDPVLEGSVRV